jgi:hypothetical protein
MLKINVRNQKLNLRLIKKEIPVVFCQLFGIFFSKKRKFLKGSKFLTSQFQRQLIY